LFLNDIAVRIACVADSDLKYALSFGTDDENSRSPFAA
jgi:hypothetical protein